MVLGGLQKLTLIDFPGRIAATVFTLGCNFRCPFCHNPELVIPGREHSVVSEDDFFSFLKKRQGKLDGICITGGEPTIQPDIIPFMTRIKELGFAVKLDTNGTQPDVVEKAIEGRIVDFIAMDIKGPLDRYAEICLADIFRSTMTVDIEKIERSTGLIRQSGLDYEFRTTVVPGLHREDDFEKIGQWLSGSKKYVLQPFRKGKILDPGIEKVVKNVRLDLEKVKNKLAKQFGLVEIRG